MSKREKALIAALRYAIQIIESYGRHVIDHAVEGKPVKKWGCRVGLTDLEESCRCWKKPALDKLRAVLKQSK